MLINCRAQELNVNMNCSFSLKSSEGHISCEEACATTSPRKWHVNTLHFHFNNKNNQTSNIIINIPLKSFMTGMEEKWKQNYLATGAHCKLCGLCESVPGTHRTFYNRGQATNKQVQSTGLCGPNHHCKRETKIRN